jgi:hypothetical protein
MLGRRAAAADRFWRRAGDPVRRRKPRAVIASNIFIYLFLFAVVQ